MNIEKTTRFFKIAFICFTLYCCKQKQHKVSEKPIADNLVLIVSNNMVNAPISIFKNFDFKNNDQVHIYTEKENDTLNIAVNKFEHIFLSSKFAPKIPLIVSAGDSLFINIKDSILTHKIKKAHDYSIPEPSLSLRRNRKKIDSIEKSFYRIDSTRPLAFETTKYEKPSPIYPLIINKDQFNHNKESLKNLTKLKLDDLKEVFKFFDSLNSNNSIGLGLSKILKEEAEKDTYESLLLLYNISRNNFILEKITSNQFLNDSIINNKNIALFLNTYINKVVLKDKKTYSRSKEYFDYKLAYDSLPNYFNGNLLVYSRMFCLNRMVDQNDAYEDIIDYYDNFKENHYDSVFVSNFDQKTLIELSKFRNIKNDVVLTKSNSISLSLDSLVQVNKNKLIYIDFWASWCAPCIAAMPASRTLRDDYKNQEVVFVYISIDRDAEKWKKASQDESLFSFDNNLLALNYPKAKFFNDLKLETIPRYILYDKNGKLIHQNAPGPGGDEIRKLLDKHSRK